MMTLSDTQQQILTAAAQHEHRLAMAPRGLPAAARNAVFRSMIKNGLLAEVPAPPEYVGLGWRQDEAGAWIALRITDNGLHTIRADVGTAAVSPPAETMPTMPRSESPAAAESGPVSGSDGAEAAGCPSTGQHGASARLSLRDAARALLAAWDANNGVALEQTAGRLGPPSPYGMGGGMDGWSVFDGPAEPRAGGGGGGRKP